MNSLIAVIFYIAKDEKDSKNKKTTRKGGLSSTVAGKIEISNQFIQDMMDVAALEYEHVRRQ